MKKGILQRVTKNWEETKMAPMPLPEVKVEPIADYPDLQVPITTPSESNKVIQTIGNKQADAKKGRRESMITIRKDYSYKYNMKPKTPSSFTLLDKMSHNPFENLSPLIASPTFIGASSSQVQSNKKEMFVKPSPSPVAKSRDAVKRQKDASSPQISILERHCYDKGPSQPKQIKVDFASLQNTSGSAISSTLGSKSPGQHASKLNVPTKQNETVKSKRSRDTEREQLKVIVAQKVESPVVKQESDALSSLKTQTTPSETKDPQNINKINNKINIIFQLNDNTKSLRKNIILHRRTPKKMVQKITIKETNNNTKLQQEESALVPDRVLCSIDTQTEAIRNYMNMSTTNPLCGESTEHLFFEDDVLISLQNATISFYEFNRLSSLFKRGEADFKLIDRVPRRLHDTLIDSGNKFQRLCYNDLNPLPIYVEMRAKQKELEDPEMCPIAFLYCNVYYIDQRRAKFSSVHLDTVKSIIGDIIYTTVPGSSYFIMAWNEKCPETKGNVTGIVKYKLTPNLDLAKLASIRQFPKLNYRTKQMNCGKDSQLITFGESQVSIFNYESGDLLMSLDLMKSYGTNLMTLAFKENYLFMIYLAEDASSEKRVIVIGVNKCEGNTFKVIQSSPVKLQRGEKIVSRTTTATNHLLVTFSKGSVILMNLNNFSDIHVSQGSLKNESVFAAANHLLVVRDRNIGLRNFTEFFLNANSSF